MTAAYIYAGPKKSKRPLIIKYNEVLWLMRMIVGEGGENCSRKKAAALLWAITNRWFLWPGSKLYPTYVSLLRAFSQPINPRWMTGGDLARKYAGRSAASAQRLARRARICATEWDDIPMPIIVAVEDFRNGTLFPPDELTTIDKARISNWASLPSTPLKHPWGIDIDGDWFFEDKNLIPGTVVVGEY